MKCTECFGKTKVLESGYYKGAFHRKRKCTKCNKIFYTTEMLNPKAEYALRMARGAVKGGVEQ